MSEATEDAIEEAIEEREGDRILDFFREGPLEPLAIEVPLRRERVREIERPRLEERLLERRPRLRERFLRLTDRWLRDRCPRFEDRTPRLRVRRRLEERDPRPRVRLCERHRRR